MPDELKALHEAATAGPWLAYFTMHGDPYVVPADRPMLSEQIANVSVAPTDYGRADAELIVYLRNNAERFIAMERALEAVESLHQPTSIGPVVCTTCIDGDQYQEPWPCPTERAITEAMGENDG